MWMCGQYECGVGVWMCECASVGYGCGYGYECGYGMCLFNSVLKMTTVSPTC